MTPEVCPVCGDVVDGTFVRVEPVRSPDTGRDHGWARTIKTFRHLPRAPFYGRVDPTVTPTWAWRECRLPIGPVFERWR